MKQKFSLNPNHHQILFSIFLMITFCSLNLYVVKSLLFFFIEHQQKYPHRKVNLVLKDLKSHFLSFFHSLYRSIYTCMLWMLPQIFHSINFINPFREFLVYIETIHIIIKSIHNNNMSLLDFIISFKRVCATNSWNCNKNRAFSSTYRWTIKCWCWTDNEELCGEGVECDTLLST